VASAPALHDFYVLVVHPPGFGYQARADFIERSLCASESGVQAAHAIYRPKEIDRRRARRADHVANPLDLPVEFACVLGLRVADTERDSHRRRHADGGRAANDHLFDRPGDLFVSLENRISLFGRQQALVDHNHALVGPFKCFDHK
jgi:hypothetical protein